MALLIGENLLDHQTKTGDPGCGEWDCAVWSEDRVFNIGVDLENHDDPSPVPN